MKLEKAIEILELAAATSDFSHKFDSRDAVLLGIEALKRLNYQRNHPARWELPLLPGETED